MLEAYAMNAENGGGFAKVLLDGIEITVSLGPDSEVVVEVDGTSASAAHIYLDSTNIY